MSEEYILAEIEQITKLGTDYYAARYELVVLLKTVLRDVGYTRAALYLGKLQ
jgi:hypothetical protein